MPGNAAHPKPGRTPELNEALPEGPNGHVACPLLRLPSFSSCDPEELRALVDWLERNRPAQDGTAFERGTVMPDGRLDLCKQALGPAGLRMLFPALVSHTHIQALLLGTDGLGDEGAAKVADLVRSNPALRTIYLGCNVISADGCALLCDAVRAAPNIHGLWLKRNPLGQEGARHVANLLRDSDHLTSLDLVNTMPGCGGIEALCTALRENRTLQRLYLSGNVLAADAAEPLGRMLEHNQSLQGLYLSVNRFGDAGCRLLAAGLRNNRGLRHLSLEANGIGHEGMIDLAEAVASHPTLIDLDLGRAPSMHVLGSSANAAGDLGAQRFAEAFQERPFGRLDLSHNDFTHQGVACLLSMFEANPSFCELKLSGNGMRRYQKQHLRELCSARQTAATDIPRDVADVQSVYRTIKKASSF